MSKKIDLHIHTNASPDGSLPPRQIIDLAICKGIKIIAITDHDSVGGIQKALNYTKEKNIRVITGVEISCGEKVLGLKEIHVIGLFIDHKNKHLKRLLTNFKKPSVKQVIKIIRCGRGIPILAHPGIYLKEMDKIIKNFIECGGRGLEIDYPYGEIYGFSKERVKFLRKKLSKIAKEKNLLISGGSDFHGLQRNVELGDYGVTEEEFERLRKQSKRKTSWSNNKLHINKQT